MAVSKRAVEHMRQRWASTGLPSGWAFHRIGEVLKRTKHRIELEDDVEYVQPVIRRGHGGIEERDRKYGSEIRTKTQYRLQTDDWLMSKVQVLHGAFGIVPRDLDGAVASSSYFTFSPTQELLLQYLWYLSHLHQFHETCVLSSVGVDIEKMVFRVADWKHFEFPLPCRAEQKKIAAILASVDEAIEATEAVIEQTRRVKKGLLQELLTRGIGHTEFKKTAIGEIPKGWEVQKLRTLLAEPTRNGYSPVCLDEETGKWVLGLGALTPDGLDIREIKAAPLDDAKVDSAMLKVGDVLVSRSNTVERVAYAAIYKGEVENCAYPDLMIRARPDRSRLHPEFLTAHLWTTYARRYFQGAAAGTSGSMVKITGSVLNNLRVPVPSLEEQREIIGRLESIDSAVGVNREFLYELQELKKGLLQDLLTGKVRVNVDEAVGEVEEAVEALAE